MTRNHIIRGDVFSARTGARGRVGFLDEVRGLCILLMVLYHGIYTLIFLFGWDITLPGGTRLFHFLFTSAFVQTAQPFVAGVFIFISGIACRYSRNNLKRGVIALGLGVIITLFTLNLMPDLPIYFGILHFMGSGMILFALLNRAYDKLPAALGLLTASILFVLTLGAGSGYVGIPGLFEINYPAAWGQIVWLIPVGFTEGGVDHFPLLPWIFLYIAGNYLGVGFVRRDMPEFLYKNRSPFLSLCGRHTIYIYMAHQPVVFGLLYSIQFLIDHFSG
ncbi:MAG: DUF1624 domain-containing protein [Oscillospiraceae bacterium]|nr:DUF1624 domain-containing protein [Oscillospiraceae bacterium]